MRDGLVACGSYGNGRTIGLDDLICSFQPCDSMIFLNSYVVVILQQILQCKERLPQVDILNKRPIVVGIKW